MEKITTPVALERLRWRMELSKENIIIFLETLTRLEKAQFLLEHLNSKRQFDSTETTSFDLEVCQSLLTQLINSPIFASYGIDVSYEQPNEKMQSLLLLNQRLKILLEGLRGDVYEYLTKSLMN